ncbi:hypothetical protein HIM_05729 [Hirsutella minnesotensis 3608]|uniref:Uncharacterized protein n=1 Tax=Hirsutella minnesotensis 3608 TaxID=1043627 RepID=A0A0F7ZP37_9HYPO|nr:hypothetical protein HIM_05729 [Hirsutella minnesotensis 3608]
MRDSFLHSLLRSLADWSSSRPPLHLCHQELPAFAGEPFTLSPPPLDPVGAVQSPPPSHLRGDSRPSSPSPSPEPPAPPSQSVPQAPRAPLNLSADALSQSSSAQRTLRHTPRLTPARRVHIEAASVGFTPSSAASEPHRPPSASFTGLDGSLYQGRDRLASNSSSPIDPQVPQTARQPPPSARDPPATASASASRGQPKPHPALRISSSTHSAILFALEEALRRPYPFTADLAEESASMADLMTAGAAPATSNGAELTSPRRPTAGPAPTGSPSGIRGPRMIMQERAAREARQRAEAERLAMERDRAEQEARLLEEARRREGERRPAGAPAGQGGVDNQQARGQHHHHQHRPSISDSTQIPKAPAPTSTIKPVNQPQPQRLPEEPQSQPQVLPPAASGMHQQSQPRPSLGTQASNPAAPPPPDNTKHRNSFPHAFERWETLSAHWEGLTSYWIRKLEQNKDDVNRDPLSQQLARQVTDLSAAGANLFHAVVELQRLRASSERKFQRWFFETRAELERAREVQAMVEAALQKERMDRAGAIREAIGQEAGASKVQKQLVEMRKELAISKEEARRAWEELGRREQEERDRTYSLQNGHPTIVGGVQVVPMTQGSSTRHVTPRDSGSYPQEHGAGEPAHRSPSPTPPATRTAGPPQGQTAGWKRRHTRPGSESSEGEFVVDVQGNYVLDAHGNKIPFTVPPSSYTGSDSDADDYETPATTNPPASGGHESPSAAAGESRWTGTYSDPQDYSGQGYGAPGWETVPRHHHPTRLSDVIEEEDERSRTSASQMSRV